MYSVPNTTISETDSCIKNSQQQEDEIALGWLFLGHIQALNFLIIIRNEIALEPNV